MTRAMLRKELAVLWSSPIPYVVGALLHLVLGVLYVDQLEVRRQAVLQPLFPIAGFLLVALVPLVTMRAVAEERRLGTLDLVLAIPVGPLRLVVAKWAAAMVTVVAVFAPAGLHVALVAWFGDPDPGPVLAGFVGLALLGAALAGVGLLCSSVTSSQPVAAVLAFFGSLLLWFASAAEDAPAAATGLVRFSLSERLRTFAGGGLDSADGGFFVVLAVGTLACAVGAVGAPRARRRWLSAMSAVAVAIVSLVAIRGLDETRRTVDLTAESTLTLSGQTLDVVDAVDERTTITALLSPSDPGRVPAATLLSRYQRRNRELRVRVLDLEGAPGEARRLGVDPVLGGIAVEQDGRIERAGSVTEQDVTAALARLLRDVDATVCFSAGHGEPDVVDTTERGVAGAVGVLERNGYRTDVVDLLARPEIPPSCTVVALIAPSTDLGTAGAAVAEWLEGGGRALVLTDPAAPSDVQALLAPYRIEVVPGLVVEGDDGARLADDPLTLVVSSFRSAVPVVQRLAPLVMPGVQAVRVAGERDGLTAVAVATSTDAAYLEREPTSFEFDPAVDVGGPVPLVATADLSRVEPDGVVRSRLVVTGDADFASNRFLAEAGNSRLLLQAVDWLALDEDLVSVTTNLAEIRPIALTNERARYARLLTAGGIPALFLLTGAFLWALRRGR